MYVLIGPSPFVGICLIVMCFIAFLAFFGIQVLFQFAAWPLWAGIVTFVLIVMKVIKDGKAT